MRTRLWLSRCVLVVATACSALSFATSVEDLQKAGHLRIDSELTPDTGLVPGQRVALTLTVATDTWFTGGTRIEIPEVPGLVILQTEQFASNASETRDGQNWVIQRWTVDVFPQRAGDFTIGPVPMQIQVNAREAGNVSGTLRAPAQAFTVSIPASLGEAEHWVAAPEFRVSQSFNRALEDLSIGDAFEQEVVFEASDLLAMMLPGYSVDKQPGLAAYPAPPTLDNSNNRGQTLASRHIRISYVIEQAGQYVLPARDYYWWNTQKAKLELLSLPETRFDVAGTAPSQQTSNAAYSISRQQWLVLIVAVTLVLVTGWLANVFLPRLPISGWRMRLSDQLQRLRDLFKPALATRLNPGSNAEQ
jgi:BatD DUF11 like domain